MNKKEKKNLEIAYYMAPKFKAKLKEHFILRTKRSNFNIARLYFFKRHSNLFFVLLDLKKKHIVTITSGFSKVGRTKKQKKSIYNLSLIIDFLCRYLTLYKIRLLKFYWRFRFNKFYYTILKQLKARNLFIVSYHYILRKPHGFVKQRKLRRV